MSKKPAESTNTSVRNLKTASCPSLSGDSKLVYEIGLDEQSELVLRITGNSNAGAFNSEWFQIKAIRAALDRAPKGDPVTADLMAPLFRRMSQNTPYFVFAVLKHERIVKPSARSKRRYEREDDAVVDAIVKALAEGKGATPAVDKKNAKAKAKQDVPEKRPSATTKTKKSPS